MRKVNIFHAALVLSIFVAALCLTVKGLALGFNWAKREAFTDQNHIQVDDWTRERTADPTWFTRGVRVIAPVVEKQEEPRRRQPR